MWRRGKRSPLRSAKRGSRRAARRGVGRLAFTFEMAFVISRRHEKRFPLTSIPVHFAESYSCATSHCETEGKSNLFNRSARKLLEDLVCKRNHS